MTTKKNTNTEAKQTPEQPIEEKIDQVVKTKPAKKLPKIQLHSLVIMIIVALIVVSGIQTYQLIQLKKGITSGGIKPAQAQTGNNTGSAPLPSSLNDLPDMVGGC